MCTPVANPKIDEFIIDVRRFHYLQSLHAWSVLTKSFEQWIIVTYKTVALLHYSLIKRSI